MQTVDVTAEVTVTKYFNGVSNADLDVDGELLGTFGLPEDEDPVVEKCDGYFSLVLDNGTLYFDKYKIREEQEDGTYKMIEEGDINVC
jgi:hypothetical protein